MAVRSRISSRYEKVTDGQIIYTNTSSSYMKCLVRRPEGLFSYTRITRLLFIVRVHVGGRAVVKMETDVPLEDLRQ